MRLRLGVKSLLMNIHLVTKVTMNEIPAKSLALGVFFRFMTRASVL